MEVKEKENLLGAWREELNNIYDKNVPSTNIGRKIYKNCMRFNLPKEMWLEILHSAFLKTKTMKTKQDYIRRYAKNLEDIMSMFTFISF